MDVYETFNAISVDFYAVNPKYRQNYEFVK